MILFDQIYENKSEKELLEIYNNKIDEFNESYNTNLKYDDKYKLKKIDSIKPNFVYVNTSFDNQTLFLIEKRKINDIRHNGASLKYKKFTNFNLKRDNAILCSALITSLNKNNLIDARLILVNENTIYTNYSKYFMYGDNTFCKNIYKNNTSIYEELIYSDANEIKYKEQKIEVSKNYGKQLSELLSINPETYIEYGYLINDGLKILIQENDFNKVVIGIFVSDIKTKKYLMIVRGFDKDSLSNMLYIIMSDALNYIKSLKKSQLNIGENLLKLQACIGRLSDKLNN